MRNRHKSFQAHEAGNAMIYVLLVIALFAALGFILSRQTDTKETSTIGAQQTDFYATQMLQASMQIKQAVDSMTFSGSGIDQLDFTTPDNVAYNTPPNAHKVFHPDGGGVILPKIPDEATGGAITDPAPGWYLGRFNNVDWTPTPATDVILTAYHISQPVCLAIDQKLLGSGTTTIPATSDPLRNILVDAGLHSGANIEFSSANCPDCDGKPSLCIAGPSNDYAFYTLVEMR